MVVVRVVEADGGGSGGGDSGGGEDGDGEAARGGSRSGGAVAPISASHPPQPAQCAQPRQVYALELLVRVLVQHTPSIVIPA